MNPWKPGRIEVIGYRDGKAVARASHPTAGARLGDKKLMVCDRVTIAVKTIAGSFVTPSEDITVR